MTDLDERLHDYASRWNAAQPADPAPTRPKTSRPLARLAYKPGVRWSAAGITLAAAITTAVLVARTDSSGPQVATQNPVVSVPEAAPPLLHRELAPTPQITLFTSHSAKVRWTFFAQAAPKDPAHGMGPTLCLGTATALGFGSGCDDPETMSSLTFDPMLIHDNPDQVLLSGVTSAPAARFSITLGSRSFTADALADPRLPGLKFFALPLSASDYTPDVPTWVVAFAGNGHPLIESPRTQAPPLPPSAPRELAPTAGGNPTSAVVWPLPGTATFTTATALINDFSARVLGLSAPRLRFAPGDSGATTDLVGIRLPATGQWLSVVAYREAGSWVLLLVGDQNQLRGVTYMPDGHPGALMSLLPPPGAAQADMTELAADGVHHFRLDAAQLGSDNASIATSPIQSMVIVYRNRSGAVIGALGGTF